MFSSEKTNKCSMSVIMAKQRENNIKTLTIRPKVIGKINEMVKNLIKYILNTGKERNTYSPGEKSRRSK